MTRFLYVHQFYLPDSKKIHMGPRLNENHSFLKLASSLIILSLTAFASPIEATGILI